MRLFAISFISVLVVIIALFIARIWGLNQQFTPYDHPLLTKSGVVYGAVVHSTDEIEQLSRIKSEAWAVVPVRMSSDKKFYVLTNKQTSDFIDFLEKKQRENPSQPIFRSNKIHEYSTEELKQFFATLVTLEDLYKTFPQQVFAISLQDNASEIHAHLAKLLEPYQADQRTVILSDTHVLLTSVKEQKPQWLYGSSRADITRLLSFESVGILPATPFKADILTTPLSYQNRPLLKGEIVEEISRRKKITIITDLLSEDFELAKGLGVKGYFFFTLEEFAKSLDQHPAP
ncbi:MAG: hypothetical protein ACLGGX_00240 [Bdellovibrionia bacterium]